MRTLCCVLAVLLLSLTTYAQEKANPSNSSRPPNTYVEPFAVPVVPSMYLANFLLLYFSSPELAANMPAYRAAVPQEVYKCLVENPEGCPYPDMAKYFAEQALQSGGSRNKNTFWPSSCQTDPRWRNLAPPEYRQPDQINQPLGRKRADQLAQLLGIEQDMVLTDEEYQCQIGAPPRDLPREIIFACDKDVTNSTGNAVIPISSYGLSLNDKGDVRSNCAPHAPCLEFNKLATNGSLFDIAQECKFVDKLGRLFQQTPLVELLKEGVDCQREWGSEGNPDRPSCIVETACPGNGAQSNNTCVASIQ